MTPVPDNPAPAAHASGRPDPVPRPSRPGRAWTTAAVAVTVAAEAAWRAADARLPASDAGALAAVADAYWALATPEGATGPGLDLLATPGGWHAWLAAGALRAFGRTLSVFDGVSAAIWAAAVLFAALLARRRAGDRAGAVAALLVASMPWLTLLARRHGPQALEAAVAVALLLALAGDRALARLRTVPLVGALGAALLALGGTSWAWAGVLLPALLWPGRRLRPWRVLGVLALWAVGATAGVADVGTALALAPGAWGAGKLGATAARVLALVDTPATIALAAAAITGAVATWRARRDGPRGPTLRERLKGWSPWKPRAPAPPPVDPAPDGRGGVTAVLWAWAAVPLVLGVTLRPSPEAWPAAALALAVLAAGPLARHAWGLAVAAGAWVLFTVPQGLPPARSAEMRALLPDAAAAPSLHVPYRPHAVWTPRTLGALLDATCRSDAWASCGVVLDQGLGAPDADDPGRLARFLLAEDRVALVNVYEASRARGDTLPIHAVLSWDCGDLDDGWRMRAPDATARLVRLAATKDLRPVWSRRVDPTCTVHWLTPRGELVDPSALPAPDAQAPTWTPRAAMDALEAFYVRYPSARDRQGRGWTARAGDDAATAPAAWAPDGSAWRRERARGE